MNNQTCIVALGQEARGDEAVGLTVADELRRRSPELWTVKSSSAIVLLEVLETAGHVVIVDSLASDGPPGRVFTLRPDQLADAGLNHRLEVAATLDLFRTLHPHRRVDVHIVGISISPKACPRYGLSPPIVSAVPRAVDQIRKLVKTHA